MKLMTLSTSNILFDTIRVLRKSYAKIVILNLFLLSPLVGLFFWKQDFIVSFIGDISLTSVDEVLNALLNFLEIIKDSLSIFILFFLYSYMVKLFKSLFYTVSAEEYINSSSIPFVQALKKSCVRFFPTLLTGFLHAVLVFVFSFVILREWLLGGFSIFVLLGLALILFVLYFVMQFYKQACAVVDLWGLKAIKYNLKLLKGNVIAILIAYFVFLLIWIFVCIAVIFNMYTLYGYFVDWAWYYKIISLLLFLSILLVMLDIWKIFQACIMFNIEMIRSAKYFTNKVQKNKILSHITQHSIEEQQQDSKEI